MNEGLSFVCIYVCVCVCGVWYIYNNEFIYYSRVMCVGFVVISRHLILVRGHKFALRLIFYLC